MQTIRFLVLRLAVLFFEHHDDVIAAVVELKRLREQNEARKAALK